MHSPTMRRAVPKPPPLDYAAGSLPSKCKSGTAARRSIPARPLGERGTKSAPSSPGPERRDDATAHHRMWVRSLKHSFEQQVRHASAAVWPAECVPRRSALRKRPPDFSVYYSSTDEGASSVSRLSSPFESPLPSPLASPRETADEGAPTQEMSLFGLSKGSDLWLQRTAMGIDVAEDAPSAPAWMREVSSHAAPPAVLPLSLPVEAEPEGPEEAVRRHWATAPVPPLLHRQSMPNQCPPS